MTILVGLLFCETGISMRLPVQHQGVAEYRILTYKDSQEATKYLSGFTHEQSTSTKQLIQSKTKTSTYKKTSELGFMPHPRNTFSTLSS